MQSAWIVIGGFWVVILLAEMALWLLFARRAPSLLLALELDESSFGLWTIGRIRICAILHTIALLAGVTVFLLWVW